MERATYWGTKSPLPTYRALTVEHSLAATLRIVADQFQAVTLGGHSHRAMPAEIRPPDRTGDATPRLTATLPRAAVGVEIKGLLRAIQAAGTREPIRVTYAEYLGDAAAPAQTWRLYAGAITFGGDSVQIVATDSNPMLRACAPVYDVTVFTGLELI